MNPTLEELKKLEKSGEEWWIFTFGYGQKHAGYYVRIWGTFETARQKMMEKYGEAWSMQYSLKRWNRWLKEKPDHIPAETLLEVIK